MPPIDFLVIGFPVIPSQNTLNLKLTASLVIDNTKMSLVFTRGK